MSSAEERAKHTSVIVSPPPTLNAATSPVCSDGQTTKPETKASGDLTGDLPKGPHYPSDRFDIEVDIDRSTIGDAGQPDGEPIDQDRHVTPQSLRDRAQDDQV
jgi:hypothetical protein